MAQRNLLIAGTHSGVGKTTVALALMATLRQRGLTVQPFKVGPDFIDPGHHTVVCGRTSRNLDTWMLNEADVVATFDRANGDADCSVIEGVMGLFDGRGPDDLRGSTADVARLIGVPVVLVVDASALAGSVAALVKGFATFHPEVCVAGVICNRVAGPRHYDYLDTAVRRYTDVIPLGWLPQRDEWRVPERHLGLTTAEDLKTGVDRWEALGRALTQTVDVDCLLDLASGGRQPPVEAHSDCALQQGADAPRSPLIVAVARDAAFCFYYADNLELLEAAGATIVPFSPLTDTSLPAGTQFLYLGGGYPELHAANLARNDALRQSIRRFHAEGGTIYAECGGLMYACRELVDAAGRVFPMLDLLPARTVMQARRAALGYVTLHTIRPSPLGPIGVTARGHEFHYSRLEPLGPLTWSAELETSRSDVRPDGLIAFNLWAAYAHLHFGSNPSLAVSLLDNARGRS
jgi:cobyrinic acid a,c-diamide synthase